MSNLIKYDPEKKMISISGEERNLYCGNDVDPIVPLLLKLQTGKLTLQEAYDNYVLYKHRGYL